jgi:hypothetical protein
MSSRRTSIDDKDTDPDWPTKRCTYCDQPFRGRRGCGPKFCSAECQRADRNQRRRETRQQQRPWKPLPHCAHCGKTIWNAKRSTARFCSDACRQKAYRRRK